MTGHVASDRPLGHASKSFTGGRPVIASPSSSPEADRVAREVRDTAITPFLAPWIARFDEVGRRNPLLWRWCLHGIRTITLPCVAAEYREHLADTKMLSVMFTTLVDDIADVKRDERMFDAARQMAEG